MIKALLFDLDDTLYREKDFVESGYRAVARYISARFGCDYHQFYSTMIDAHDIHGRQMVMTVVKEMFPHTSISIDNLVSIYRDHRPEIQMYPGYLDLLRELSHSYQLGIITDGMPEVQESKVRALRVEGVMDNIIYTWKYGEEKQKPHPLSFELMLKSLQTEASNALYVGDNPSKDCAGAHRAGIKFVHIRPPVNSNDSRNEMPGNKPEFSIETLFQLRPILQELN
jgi:putative hydrolase of the HAD superfamily